LNSGTNRLAPLVNGTAAQNTKCNLGSPDAHAGFYKRQRWSKAGVKLFQRL